MFKIADAPTMPTMDATPTLSDTTLAPNGRYVDVATARNRVCVRIQRTGSRYGITKRKRAILHTLGVDARSPRPKDHPITRSVAGQVSGVSELLGTHLVLPKGNTVEAEPHEVVQIVREQPTVNTAKYEIDGRPAVSFQWSTGERSRVELLDGFNLFAWTSRLSAGKAVRLLKRMAKQDASLIALTSSAGVHSEKATAFDRQYVYSRADRVRLLRLENPKATFLWEIRDDLDRGTKHADFVVMAKSVNASELDDLITETGMPRIALASTEIRDLAGKIGAL